MKNFMPIMSMLKCKEKILERQTSKVHSRRNNLSNTTKEIQGVVNNLSTDTTLALMSSTGDFYETFKGE